VITVVGLKYMVEQNPKPVPTPGQGRKPRKRLATSEKFEVFVQVLTQQATQREAAERWGVDRSTVVHVCKTAKQGALDALAASVPGRAGKSPELAAAREEIERLRATVTEQAVTLHLHQGKSRWDWPLARSRRGWTHTSRPGFSLSSLTPGRGRLVDPPGGRHPRSRPRAAAALGRAGPPSPRLDDAKPGPLEAPHALLDSERVAIVKVAEDWGEIDRSHRKLAHRGSRPGSVLRQ
jgi:transposase-like protein